MAVETIPALFLHSVKTHDKPDAFQRKFEGTYNSISHREVLHAVDRISRGLAALGLARGDRVALLSENRLEWALADLGALSAGCVDVPIYATLPPKQVEFILRDCEARAVFVSTREQIDKLLAIRAGLPHLRHVITFDREAAGEGALTLVDVEAMGDKISSVPSYEERIAAIDKSDWASIIYTSGTTGEPKGAILTHWNFVSNALSSLECLSIGPTDRCLSFLPLSHVFERTAGFYTMLYAGATIAYAESMDTVADNMRETSPTVVLSVPRLYEKMYARILDSVTAQSTARKKLFFWAIRTGKQYVKETHERRLRPATAIQYKIASRLVFRKLKARTGGRLRFFASGSAPLARDIAEFFYAAGLPIFEGYGLTETSPVVSVNTFTDFKFGTVGRPIPGVDVRIAEDGEILVRGPNVMQGYYKKPDLTSQAIRDGWFCTGDIGHLDEDGFLTITDRKKDLIVTAGGKNVAPQPIENLLKTNKYIAQAVVLGDRRKFIAAVIVPNFDNLLAFAKAVGIPDHDRASLVRDPRVVKKYHDEIELMSEHLASFERIKKFILLDRDFSIEEGEVTPTLKVKRKAIEKKLEREIDAMYAS